MAASVRVVGYDSPFAAPAQAAWNPEGWYTAQGATGPGAAAMPSLGGHTLIVVVLALLLLIAIAAHHGRLPFAGAAVKAGL